MRRCLLICCLAEWRGGLAANSCKPTKLPDSQPAAVPLSDGSYLPVLKNSPTGTVDKVIAFVHGVRRNYDDFWRYAMDSARNADKQDSTVVVAPWFADKSCTAAQWLGNPRATGNMASWKVKTAQWVMGSGSDGSNVTLFQGVTSYEAYDTLLGWLTQQYPSVKEVFCAGYSSGSQFGTRWSIMSPEGAGGKTKSGLPLTAMWGDSSSYLYFDSKRPAETCTADTDTPVTHTCTSFTVPSDTCRDTYDDFPTGLRRLGLTANTTTQKWQTHYLKDKSGMTFNIPDAIRTRFVTKDVHYVFGVEDKMSCTVDQCSARCSYQITGANRLQRGLNYMAHLDLVFSKESYKASYAFGENAHSAQMFTSGELFNQKVFQMAAFKPCLDNGPAWEFRCWSPISQILGIVGLSALCCCCFGVCLLYMWCRRKKSDSRDVDTASV